MTFTILRPAPAELITYASSPSAYDSEDDVPMVEPGRPAKRPRRSGPTLVTPGEVVTEDPQWMR
jgi:exosome complex component RRP4